MFCLELHNPKILGLLIPRMGRLGMAGGSSQGDTGNIWNIWWQITDESRIKAKMIE